MTARVDVLRSASEMREIAAEWDNALSPRGTAECSLTSTWIIQWLEAFDSDGGARILCVRDTGGEIVGQAAFLKSAARGMPMLTALTNTYANRTTIAANKQGRQAIADWLRSQPEAVIRFERCPAGAGCDAIIPNAVTSQTYDLPIIGTATSYETYLAGRSANFRKSVKRARSRHKTFEITFHDSGAGLVDEILAVSRSTWKFEAGTAIASSPEVQRFYTGLVAGTFPSAAAQPFVTMVRDQESGEAVAFLLGLIHAGTMFALKMGYDERIRDSHPGFALLEKCVETACARDGIARLDLDALGPHGDYKLRWATEIEKLESIVGFQSGPKGWLMKSAWFLRGRAKQAKGALQKVFERTGS